jgi:transposase
LIDVLPKGSKFHAGHYICHILSPLPEINAHYQDDPRIHFVIHADNARPHCAKPVTQFLDHNSLHRAPHYPYSPDLAPLDFWLFEYLKGMLHRSSFDELNELLSVIQKFLSEVDRETLDVVFQKWMIRLQKCIDGNGEYVE